MESDSPQKQASVLIDSKHPEAGKGGVVPPVHSRFPPGVSANPGGVPKGTKHASPRRALLRLLGKGWEKDADAEGDDDKLGAESIALAKVILDAARNGNAEAARAVATLIDQAEGKPQEKVEHSGEIKRVSINLEARPPEIETP